MTLTPTEATEVADIHNPVLNTFWSRPQAEVEADLAQIRSQPVTKFSEMPRDEEITDPITLSMIGPGAFAVTKHADILEMSRKPEVWSSASGITVTDTPPEFNEFFGSMISMDDPRHGRLRRLISAGFTPRMLAKLEDSVTKQASDIIDNVCERGEVDFVVDVAAQLPLKIVCDLMGIPDSELEFCFNQSNIILGIGDPEYAPPGDIDPITALLTAGGALANLMEEIAESKKGGDADDLTTILVNAEIEGEKLSHADIASFFVLLVVAGNETTRNAISWGLTYLTQNPDQRELWRADFDGLAHSAVEEIVRLASPVTYMRRTATQDTEIAGQPVAVGEKALMFYLAANRDEDVFANPYDFDIRRDPNPHVGFGGPGPHFCLGAHLARREIKVMYRELFDRLPDIEATSEPDVLASSFIHGVKHLTAEFTPTSPR